MAIKLKLLLKDISKESFTKLFDLLKTLKDEPHRVYVLDRKKLRSSSQNRYYWGVILDSLAQHTGIEVHEMHELCKHKFNLKTNHIDGVVYEWGGSTKLLNTKMMTDYIEQIRTWANVELDLNIPEANELSDETILELMNQGI